jgi:hypothetical protein
MPWQLTTPITVGTFDPEGDITHIQAAWVGGGPRQNKIEIVIEYGRLSGSDFVSAASQPPNKALSHTVEGDDFVTLKTTHQTNDGELTWDATARAAYEELFAKGIIDPGSIV